MNRVRIVAVGAVALGATVAAGTKFQQQRDIEALQTQVAAPTVENIASSSLVLRGPDDAGGAIASIEPSPVRTNAPSLVTASSISLPEADVEVQSPQLATAPLAETQDETTLLLAEALRGTDETERAQSDDTPLAAASVVPNGGVASHDTAIAQSDPNLARSVRQDPQGRNMQLADGALPANEQADPEQSAEMNACEVWLVATPSSSAMIDMSIYAPCDAGERVEIGHAGLRFDALIGSDSQFMAQIPALASEATVTVQFADGRVVSDTTEVDDAGIYERTVLLSHAPSVFGVNAYEFGASFGETGHVYAANTREPGTSGYLTLLGDTSLESAKLAQVYTYPVGISSQNGAVALEIEAAITETSCGRTVEALTMDVRAGQTLQDRAISLEMPECDGAGGFVILQDVMPELSVAMN